jgi:hypothetical protein
MENDNVEFMEALGRRPDFLSNEKILSMTSSIYKHIIEYNKNSDSEKISELISDFGVEQFVQWFINEVYLPEISDIKVICYITDNINDISGVISAALANIEAKHVIANNSVSVSDAENKQNKEDDAEDGEGTDEGTDAGGAEVPPEPQGALVIPTGDENMPTVAEPKKNEEGTSPLGKAYSFVDSMITKHGDQ